VIGHVPRVEQSGVVTRLDCTLGDRTLRQLVLEVTRLQMSVPCGLGGGSTPRWE
jgi:hypothetical protein